MRILLINPTITGEPEPLHIGLACLASYIHLHSPHEARVLDFVYGRSAWKARLREAIEGFGPDIVGIYVSNPYFPSVKEIVDEVKRIDRRIPVLAGGHHATLAPEEVISHGSIDMLVVGEGEKTMVQLLDALEAGGPLEGVTGLWWRKGDGIERNPLGEPLDVDEIPDIDWGVYDEEVIRNYLFFFGILPVMASRGCPYSCTYCAIPDVQKLYGGKRFFRLRDPVAVVDEIEQQYERYGPLGMRVVFFYDLNFLIDHAWVKQFVEEYKRRGLNERLKWSAFSRADHINKEVLDTLRDSGCIHLRIGIESANEHMRNHIYDKHLPQDALEEGMRLLAGSGISTTGYFIVGGPGERPEWLLESLTFSIEQDIDHPVFFLYKALAGTRAVETVGEYGSTIDEKSLNVSTDYLRGIHLKHEHITRNQLRAFTLMTRLLFGTRTVLTHIRRDGLAFFTRMARYVYRGLRVGLGPYECFMYFVMYGYDHLSAPIATRRGRIAKAFYRASVRMVSVIMGLLGPWS